MEEGEEKEEEKEQEEEMGIGEIKKGKGGQRKKEGRDGRRAKCLAGRAVGHLSSPHCKDS